MKRLVAALGVAASNLACSAPTCPKETMYCVDESGADCSALVATCCNGVFDCSPVTPDAGLCTLVLPPPRHCQ
jgi:hypothetical protein